MDSQVVRIICCRKLLLLSVICAGTDLTLIKVLGLQGQGIVGMQDDISDDSKSEDDGDGKKPRSKKQLEQKKVVVNFIKAVTRVSDEIMQGYSVAGKQKSFPLDKVRTVLLSMRRVLTRSMAAKTTGSVLFARAN